MYNEVEYWNIREEPNADKSGSPELIKFVAKHIEGDIILDVGAGVGRVMEAYKDRELFAYDITPQYKDRLFEKADSFGIDCELTVGQPNELPYEDNQFESCVSTAVLFHQRPSQIEKAMKELKRVAKKIVVATWSDDKIDTKDSDSHCYSHDYEGICKKYGWTITDKVFDERDKLVCFCYK